MIRADDVLEVSEQASSMHCLLACEKEKKEDDGADLMMDGGESGNETEKRT